MAASRTNAIAALAVATTGSTTTIGKQFTGTETVLVVRAVPAGMVVFPEAAYTRVEPGGVGRAEEPPVDSPAPCSAPPPSAIPGRHRR